MQLKETGFFDMFEQNNIAEKNPLVHNLLINYVHFGGKQNLCRYLILVTCFLVDSARDCTMNYMKFNFLCSAFTKVYFTLVMFFTFINGF